MFQCLFASEYFNPSPIKKSLGGYYFEKAIDKNQFPLLALIRKYLEQYNELKDKYTSEKDEQILDLDDLKNKLFELNNLEGQSVFLPKPGDATAAYSLLCTFIINEYFYSNKQK